ncbi:hypothetical protein AXG93_2189s1330 [Marchantia polymorpha subsp. ruderalis]|uniref:Uncharacterized protein n=1 Tax=Marchantia polymorpha subsp. ruderalis TaxID=1480154 RepID=A0A176WQW4_MARPO|nr:hypothetical protein AXG93_2189s1330 [Marchantia polymorpha subsp. ruderalis]
MLQITRNLLLETPALDGALCRGDDVRRAADAMLWFAHPLMMMTCSPDSGAWPGLECIHGGSTYEIRIGGSSGLGLGLLPTSSDDELGAAAVEAGRWPRTTLARKDRCARERGTAIDAEGAGKGASVTRERKRRFRKNEWLRRAPFCCTQQSRALLLELAGSSQWSGFCPASACLPACLRRGELFSGTRCDCLDSQRTPPRTHDIILCSPKVDAGTGADGDGDCDGYGKSGEASFGPRGRSDMSVDQRDSRF